MSEPVIPEEVHILKAAQLKNMGLLSHAQLCNAYRELAAIHFALEAKVAEHAETIAGLEQENEDLRCPLTVDAHRAEKMQQHYCPNWSTVRQQAETIAQLEQAAVRDEMFWEEEINSHSRSLDGWEQCEKILADAITKVAEQAATIERLTEALSWYRSQPCRQ